MSFTLVVKSMKVDTVLEVDEKKPLGEVGKLVQNFTVTSHLNSILCSESEGEETETVSHVVGGVDFVVEQDGGSKRAKNAKSSTQQKASGTEFKMDFATAKRTSALAKLRLDTLRSSALPRSHRRMRTPRCAFFILSSHPL